MSRPSQYNVMDVWAVGSTYESFIGRWSRFVSVPFLEWLSIPEGKSWLDIGCGTGVLCRTILDISAPADVKGIDQSPGFIAFAQDRIHDRRITFEVGSAESLNVKQCTCDVVVSALVLNFIPRGDLAISEMKRVTKPGGVVAAYVWDYADKMQILRYFWDAVVKLDPQALSLDEGRRFPLCNPEALETLFVAQGLDNVEVKAIDILAHFVGFQDYWSPFLGGQGPAPSYVASLTMDQQSRLKEEVRCRLPISTDGTIDVLVRAWAVRGYT